MTLLAVGLNHQTAPSPVLERAALGHDEVIAVLKELLAGEHIAEAVVVSTCNRVEVYAESATFHGGLAEMSDVLVRVTGLPHEELTAGLYVHHEARAVQHLFSVACGLDSMLVGEAQILGQVRSAFRLAQEQETTGQALTPLFRETLRVGKRVHSETGIDDAAASLVGVAVRLAAERLGGSLQGRRALVVGAGSTGALAGAVLRRQGVSEVVVANRTAARATRLAASLDGHAVGLEGIEDALAVADVVVAATGSSAPVVGADVVGAAVARRAGRPLVLLDLALPHDVDPVVAKLPGVTLLDLDALRGRLAGSPAAADVAAVRAIVTEEAAAFTDRQRALSVAPTVIALRAQAAEVVRGELDRLAGRLPELAGRERVEVEATVRRVVDKLLHSPTVRVKELAESPGGDRYAEALRELFGLDRGTTAAVSAPATSRLDDLT